jgi:hypothetical protein
MAEQSAGKKRPVRADVAGSDTRLKLHRTRWHEGEVTQLTSSKTVFKCDTSK